MGYSISLGSNKNIHYNIGYPRQNSNVALPMPMFIDRRKVATPDVMKKINRMIAKEIPLTKLEMSSK